MKLPVDKEVAGVAQGTRQFSSWGDDPLPLACTYLTGTCPTCCPAVRQVWERTVLCTSPSQRPERFMQRVQGSCVRMWRKEGQHSKRVKYTTRSADASSHARHQWGSREQNKSCLDTLCSVCVHSLSAEVLALSPSTREAIRIFVVFFVVSFFTADVCQQLVRAKMLLVQLSAAA